jgi:hypothetical protein
MTTEPTGKPTPKSVLEAILGEQTAHYQEKAAELALRSAAEDARRTRIKDMAGTVFYVLFVLAAMFGLVLGCVAMWNAVLG